MTEYSPDPKDPWAPPERPSMESVPPTGAAGPAPVHDQPTIVGMAGHAPTPPPIPTPTPAPAPTTPAYGYPAQPDPGAYAYPGPPPAQPTYGHPGYPGHPGYLGHPGYPGYPGYRPMSNGFGIASLVLGILGVVTCWVGLLFAIPAVVFGILGRGKANRGEADNGPMALAGIILGAVGIVLGLLLVALMVTGLMLDPGSGSDVHGPSSSNTQIREQV
ncbi:DUF4190 domain-containing protein [Streptomyces sp. RerS4]|uniref:DUF4190 domain-containing protein n=1 Tax=Streptomyces sp. RerS4 TaxID=2942449 RepID=UPI00201BC4D1|nr:DUF4190 domain-containing protein [Streptomyces sp. RerS4]UQX03241.1 DUF4190 domain-containing protein [Streptomyces sp. RerS4]